MRECLNEDGSEVDFQVDLNLFFEYDRLNPEESKTHLPVLVTTLSPSHMRSRRRLFLAEVPEQKGHSVETLAAPSPFYP